MSFDSKNILKFLVEDAMFCGLAPYFFQFLIEGEDGIKYFLWRKDFVRAVLAHCRMCEDYFLQLTLGSELALTPLPDYPLMSVNSVNLIKVGLLIQRAGGFTNVEKEIRTAASDYWLEIAVRYLKTVESQSGFLK